MVAKGAIHPHAYLRLLYGKTYIALYERIILFATALYVLYVMQQECRVTGVEPHPPTMSSLLRGMLRHCI